MLDWMRNPRRPGALLGLAAAGLALTLAACGGGGGGSATGTGNLRLALTDAPACGYDAVNVTVQKVRVHQSASAGESDAGWSEVAVNKRIDLLGLTNGVLSELGQTALPAGKYTQLRLVLAANDATTPLANSVVVSGSGAEQPLTTPSAQQSGLKMNVDIDVGADQLADFVLDFDACKSIVRAGASGNRLLKPVVSVIPRFVSGVQGSVDASIAAGGSQVSLQQAGVIVKATAPDATGHYLLQPVAPGSYDLVVASAGHATAVVTGVTVTADTVTSIAGTIAPPTSASGSLLGVIATGATPVDAGIVARQTLASGAKIEVAGAAADSLDGSYALSLPIAAPLVAPYAAGPLTFTPDATAAAKYTLTATFGTSSKTVGPFSVTSGGTLTNNITFP